MPTLSYRSHQPILCAAVLCAACLSAFAAVAQPQASPTGEPRSAAGQQREQLSAAPAMVDVRPVARDEEIRARLQSVLVATGWFIEPQVRVDQGIVFLNGRTATEELKKWAGDLARNTQDVVAVANRMVVPEPSVWDLGPAWSGLATLWRDFIRSLPFLMVGMSILALSAVAGVMASRAAKAFMRQRIEARLLRTVVAGAIGALVFLIGTYIVLRVSGLTQLALTVVGGTGLIGLAVGIAFRDITENFLASIFLSMQRPFETGDLVEIAGVTGYVQQLNVRTTIVMALDGNLVQIPNATVYKSTLRNFTTNANRREDFVVGIGYDDSITDAQEIARAVLAEHPAVLDDPEPSVLVDSLGSSTVNLRVYFWLNGCEHSWLKVRSSVIRLVKRAFQANGISMPDEARELVFPQGIPVTMLDPQPAAGESAGSAPARPPRVPQDERDEVSTKAEAGLYSEAAVIEDQARQAQQLKVGDNLLPSTDAAAAEKAKGPAQ